MNKQLTALLACSIATQALASEIVVGPGSKYEKPSAAAAAARNGDTIRIMPGEYRGDVAVWTQDGLTIRGEGGRPHLIADGRAAEDKAIWVVKGDNTVIENIEFSGAAVSDENGAGIRLEGTNLTIRECSFHDNENGILTGANPESHILIEYSEFSNNGYGDGYSHNMYIGRVGRFTLRFSYVHHARVGHQVKSRASRNYIMFNRLMDEETGTSSYLIDLPDPGRAWIVGNELQQGPDAENWTMIHSAQETSLVNNTLVNDRGSGVFVSLSGDGTGSLIQNNIFAGRGTVTVNGATLRNNLTSVDQRDRLFADRERYDYRLKSGSSAVDAGSAPDPAFDVFWEYVHVANRKERSDSGPVDIGAHAN